MFCFSLFFVFIFFWYEKHSMSEWKKNFSLKDGNRNDELVVKLYRTREKSQLFCPERDAISFEN